MKRLLAKKQFKTEIAEFQYFPNCIDIVLELNTHNALGNIKEF